MNNPTTGRYKLIGANGSPYSMKMRSILRYRHLPHDWILRTTRNDALFEDVRPALIPILKLPEDNSAHVDSTKLAYLLEERHPATRSIIPSDPVQAFFSHLIEDMADEWLTKCMFHYRWMYEADIKYAMQWIIDDRYPDANDTEREELMKAFATRQIQRMPLVGCTEKNTIAVERSYHRILEILEGEVNSHQYLFGSRPALADFGLFGQLKTLATDPTPQGIMREKAQRTESWVRLLDDASGITGEWADDNTLTSAAKSLLVFAGDVYLPFLQANNNAQQKGQETFSLSLLGSEYEQGTFKYQAKCLQDLKARYKALAPSDKERADPILKDAGCFKILSHESDPS
ncbi:MAG: glutathione S-transferase N-terminal domain-containing protein [Sneathiella sp.]